MFQIFIVDDEAAIRAGLKEIVPWEEYGVEICGEAANGEDALRFIAERRPDIVVSDIRMPVMNGLELIRRVRESGGRSRFIVLSGFDDFQYVKEAIQYGVENYLLKPVNVDELKQTISQVTRKLESELQHRQWDSERREMIRSNILNRAVMQQISSLEFRDKLNLINPQLTLVHSELQVAVIDCAFDEPGRPPLPPEVSRRLEDVCGEVVEPAKGIVFADFAGRLVVIFTIREGEPDRRQIRRDLMTIRDRFPAISGLQWIVTVGNRVSGYKQLHVSYQNALGIQPYRLYDPEANVIFYADMMAKRSAESHPVVVDAALIEDALKDGKREAVTGYIDDCFDRLSQRGTEPGSVYTLGMEIVISILRTIRSAGIAPSEIFDDEARLLDTVREFKDMGHLRRWLHDKVDAVLAVGRLRNESHLSKVTKELLAYIEEHYQEDLSLKSLSQEMHFNSVYMGRLFRNETGDVFSEYVNRVRIDKSKHLLRSTSRKVVEIAKAVGFGNANYYSAIFKELTGMTPSEFRSRNS